MNQARRRMTHPQARGSHHGAGGDGPNTCLVRAHDAQKLVRAKRALGAASAASKRVIDAKSIRAEPSCVSAGAGQTRMVSVARIWLGSWESARAFKGIFCHDISEFESYMPSRNCGLHLTRSSAFDAQLEGVYFGMWNGSSTVRCFVRRVALTDKAQGSGQSRKPRRLPRISK
jgi:hypothetical protein